MTPAARAYIDGSVAVTAETIRRLCCDATETHLVHHPDGSVTIAIEEQPTLPRWARRAAKRRDKFCRFPGCSNQRVDIHHIRHRGHGGDHDLDNLALLCRYHHRLVHIGGWTMQRIDGELFFYDRDGRHVPAGTSGVYAPRARTWRPIIVETNQIVPNTSNGPQKYQCQRSSSSYESPRPSGIATSAVATAWRRAL